jgi:cytochrome P450
VTIDAVPTAQDPTDPGAIDLMDLDAFAEDREMPLFDALRTHDPVHWNPPSERGPGFWALTRYADVRTAASGTPELTSGEGTQIVDRKVEGALRSIHHMDGAEHVALRRVTIPHLRSVKIGQWQERIDESVGLLLDEAESLGSFDLVDVVSARLPMLVLSRVLGVPAADAPRMVDWTNRMTSSDPDAVVDAAALAEARTEVMDYFAHLTAARRDDPQDDLVSAMVHGAVQGRPLTPDELAAYYIVLVAAGNETTRHLVSSGAIALHRNDAWGRLEADGALLPTTVEEMFRWGSAVAAMRRTATAPFEIDGTPVAAGDRVVLFFSAANRDPDVFVAPHEFWLDRSPNEHLSFGWGAHFCLGSHLARAEVRGLFAEVLRRGTRFELDGEPRRLRANLFRGWQHVPVRIVRADGSAA